jgi:hypothetical protein
MGVLMSVLGALMILVATSQSALPEERIVDFASDIQVHPDGSMTVTETIRVESEGKEIKRGIYRDFPTDYRDRHGNRVVVDFTVVEVLRDGGPEPFHTERLSNGVRVYVGEADVFIPKGQHVYRIAYRTDRQLGFFEGFDELYWNVTGDGWAFTIERARARIELPEGAHVIDKAAYTGRTGERGQAFTHGFDAGGAIWFETTRPLAPGEALTIAVAWPPGFVARPSGAEKLGHFLGDNSVILAGLIGLGLLLVYYLFVWFRVGRDPARGTIVPLYAPPKGVSPAGARYVTRMGFDNKVFAAAIVSMAVKGYLTITESARKVYTLAKTERGAAALSAGERALARKLFTGRRREIELKQTNHKKLQAAKKSLREWLRTEFETVYFLRNRGAFFPGLGLSGVALLLLVIAAEEPAAAAFICVWLAGWSVAVYFLFRTVWRAWRNALATGSLFGSAGAFAMTLFALPFFGGEIMGLSFFAETTSVGGALILVAIQLTNLLFYHLLKAPTRLGRRLMDQIEGFADYLSVAEKDRMNFLNPPERTPELFERYIPYALALGVEQAWSEQFSDVLARAGATDAKGSYSPRWYSGPSFEGNVGDFASSLGGGFTGAISSASSAPGSSSGSGGGGSSGGGGGGGGGGGW